jgi:hypothetical protein
VTVAVLHGRGCFLRRRPTFENLGAVRDQVARPALSVLPHDRLDHTLARRVRHRSHPPLAPTLLLSLYSALIRQTEPRTKRATLFGDCGTALLAGVESRDNDARRVRSLNLCQLQGLRSLFVVSHRWPPREQRARRMRSR